MKKNRFISWRNKTQMQRTVRKLKFLIIIVAMAGIAACKSPANTSLVGGFNKSTKLTSDEKKLFKEVMRSHPGLELTPQKVCRQVVAGINYRFECIDTNKKQVMVVVYQPLPGNGDARITSIDGKSFDTEDF